MVYLIGIVNIATMRSVCSPVLNLRQLHLLLRRDQHGHIVPDDAHQEGDDDDGQEHPDADVRIDEQLGHGDTNRGSGV